MPRESGFWVAPNWPYIRKITMTSQFLTWRHHQIFLTLFIFLIKFSYWTKIHVNIITGSGVMIIFLRDWPEIRKSEIPPSEFFSISGDQGKLGIPNLAQGPLIKFYWMLQNARVIAFTVSELLRENQWGERVKLPPPPLRLGLMNSRNQK